jgi:hypothetical protein
MSANNKGKGILANSTVSPSVAAKIQNFAHDDAQHDMALATVALGSSGQSSSGTKSVTTPLTVTMSTKSTAYAGHKMPTPQAILSAVKFRQTMTLDSMLGQLEGKGVRTVHIVETRKRTLELLEVMGKDEVQTGIAYWVMAPRNVPIRNADHADYKKWEAGAMAFAKGDEKSFQIQKAKIIELQGSLFWSALAYMNTELEMCKTPILTNSTLISILRGYAGVDDAREMMVKTRNPRFAASGLIYLLGDYHGFVADLEHVLARHESFVDLLKPIIGNYVGLRNNKEIRQTTEKIMPPDVMKRIYDTKQPLPDIVSLVNNDSIVVPDDEKDNWEAVKRGLIIRFYKILLQYPNFKQYVESKTGESPNAARGWWNLVVGQTQPIGVGASVQRGLRVTYQFDDEFRRSVLGTAVTVPGQMEHGSSLTTVSPVPVTGVISSGDKTVISTSL